MKTLFLVLMLSAASLAQSQIPPSPGGGSPVSPGQNGQPFNGTNPTGEPNQLNPGTPSSPSMPGSTMPSRPSVTPNPVVPITTPSVGSKPFHRLFQDPSRTPSDPKPVASHHVADGSTGKYHRPKKAMSGKTFSHNKIGVKRAHKGASERSHNKSSDNTH